VLDTGTRPHNRFPYLSDPTCRVYWLPVQRQHGLLFAAATFHGRFAHEGPCALLWQPGLVEHVHAFWLSVGIVSCGLVVLLQVLIMMVLGPQI